MALRRMMTFFFAGFLALTGAAHATPLRTEAEWAWLEELQRQAIGEGIDPATVHAALDDFTPNARVLELDQKQPEGTVSFATYRRNTITPARVRKGAELMRLYARELAAIEAQTGVPPQIVVALWGIESSFGQNMGGFEVVNALATLAYEGRRAEFFRGELLAALRVLEREGLRPSEMRGSWAGAMGQCQFMPTTYLKYGADGNGDGRIDIWGDTADVLASIAHYLAAEGWRRDLAWVRQVHAVSVSAEEIGLARTHTLEEWAAMGVTNLDGTPLPRRPLRASLVQPDSESGERFLVYDNLRALMRWNRSTYFAVSVGLLSEAVRVGED